MVDYRASAKRTLLYVSVTVAFLLPLFSSAATAATFARNHQLWDTGPDILTLQQWLNQNGDAVAEKGPGSPAHETDFFGLRTYHALLEFQATHHLPATGFFGPLTRAAISTSPSNLPSSTSNLPSPQFSTPLPGYAPGEIILGGGGSNAKTAGGGGGSTSDSTPPSAPTNLSATAISSSEIDLSWTASNDNGGGDWIASYKIFRGGVQVATTTSATTYDDTGLSADTTYSYTVEAYDAAGNVSAASVSANAATQVAPYNRATYVGMNLNNVSYFTTEQHFLDIFKTGYTQENISSPTNGWLTQCPDNSTFDTHEEQYLKLDSNGWPTSLTATGEGGPQTFDAIGILLLRGQPTYPSGNYVVLYQGQGALNFGLDATVVSTSIGRDIINVATPTSLGIWLYITSTDPNHTGDYLRDIQVVYSPNSTASCGTSRGCSR